MTLRKGLALLIFGILLLGGCQSNKDKLNLEDQLLDRQGTYAMNLVGNSPVEIELTGEEYSIRGTEILETSKLFENQSMLKIIGDEKLYQLNLEDMIWSPIKELVDSDLIIPAVKGSFIWVKEGQYYTLYYQAEGEKKKVCGGIAAEDIDNFVLKEDGSRLAFVDFKNKEVRLYFVDKERLTVIGNLQTEELMQPLKDSVKFSPQGGYITFTMGSEGIPRGFVSYGADSGRLIHELIYGIYPQWSHDEANIAFLYRENEKPVDRLQWGGQSMILSDKIGIFNRRSGKITIWDEMQNTGYMMGTPTWSTDSHYLTYLTGVEGPTDIRVLNVNQKTITHLQDEGNLQGVAMNGQYIAYSACGDEEQLHFTIKSLNGDKIQTFDDVMVFQLKDFNEIKPVSFALLDEKLIYVKDNCIYQMVDDKSICIFKNNHEILYIQHLKGLNRLAVKLRDPEGIAYSIIPFA